MGNTTTSLHLLKPAKEVRAIERDIEAAYKQLGYEPARTGAEPQKRVLLAQHGADRAFLSVHDSDNAKLDSGELKQLAVALSKKLKTAAVITSIYDSDRFEFIVFNKGKQVDAVVSDPDDHNAGLKMLKAGKRTSTWKDIFFAAATYRAMTTPGAPGDAATRLATMLEQERAFDHGMQRVGKVDGAFAEDGLGVCCEVAGLDVRNVLTRDPIEDIDGSSASALTFVKSAVADQPATPGAAAREIQLAHFITDDDWTAPKYYPAAWPVDATHRPAVRWLVTSANAGFSGLKLEVDLPDAPPSLTGKLSIQALPFYNGQITTQKAVASIELKAPPLSAGAWTFDIAPFVIPDLDPQTRKQLILVIVLELDGIGTNAVTLMPKLSTTSPVVADLALPPARLQLQRPTWVPRCADATATANAASILKLNAPTVFSMSALVDDKAPTLSHVRGCAEAWLAALSPAVGTSLVVRTLKHMNASFRVAKSEKTLPLACASDKLWLKLFDEKSDYQTVMLRVMPEGRPFPVAGFTWQAALRDDRLDAVQSLANVRNTIAPYLRADDHAHPLDNEGGGALALSAWMLNDPAIFDAMGTTPDRLSDLFEGWMGEIDPIQAWMARAAWTPLFDDYENYHHTPYETASSVDWFRSGLNGLLAGRAWACRRLRFVAPTMWLGSELTAMLDTERLGAVAELSRSGSVTRVQLRRTHTLDDLEVVIEPILPKQPE